MSLPESSPKLSKWFFLLSDALLITVAAFIAANSPRPLTPTAILAIVGCVSIGAIVTAAALIADYVRKQEEAFDDRQRALESLSRTVATSAEQISIAAAGLNEIGELVTKSLKHVEHLPHKLQEKINEFTRQLNEFAVTENEALQQEINTLRASEAEKLEAAGDRIAKATTELARIEAGAVKHATAAHDTLARLPAAFAQARHEAESSLTAASSRALHALEEKFAGLTRTLETKLAALEAVAAKIPQVAVVVAPAAPAPVVSAAAPAATAPAMESAPAVPETTSVTTGAVNPEPVSAPDDETAPEPTESKPRKPRAPRKAKVDELVLPMPGDESAEPPAATSADEFTQLAPDETAPARSVSADGATRLLVTAYIGIGNRLFIRGDGPGLSREKGVPLQFVSIGRWRWETTEAAGPVCARLYKNDETECVTPGELTLEAGHQAEVTAVF